MEACITLHPWASPGPHPSSGRKPVRSHITSSPLPRPRFPSAVRDCPRRSKPFRYFCQQACQHFKLETCLPGFEIFHLTQTFDGDSFGGGGRGKLFKNKYNSWFPYPCCCRTSFSVWFQLISLQFLLLSLSEDRRVIGSTKSSHIENHEFSMLLYFKQNNPPPSPTHIEQKECPSKALPLNLVQLEFELKHPADENSVCGVGVLYIKGDEVRPAASWIPRDYFSTSFLRLSEPRT